MWGLRAVLINHFCKISSVTVVFASYLCASGDWWKLTPYMERQQSLWQQPLQPLSRHGWSNQFTMPVPRSLLPLAPLQTQDQKCAQHEMAA